jgi:hypothetical protein
MNDHIRLLLQQLFNLPLSDRLYVIEQVLSSMRKEFQKDLEEAIRAVQNRHLGVLPEEMLHRTLK